MKQETGLAPSDPAALPDRGGSLWWSRGRGIVGRGRALSIQVGLGSTRGSEAWAELQEVLASRRGAGESAIAIGSFTFDPQVGGSVLYVPEEVSIDEGIPDTAVPVTGEGDRVRHGRGEMDELRWLDEVSGAIASIEQGALSKVVLARDEVVWSKTPFSERTIAMRLAQTFPECFTFVCDGLVGATPELLIRQRGRDVESVVLAGSARRGNDPDDDAAEAEGLINSDKEREEHSYALESVRDALAGVSSDVIASPEPEILRLANVQHLATRITARLDDPAPSVLQLVDLLHPTAAVGGVPREAALDRIRHAEGNLRGRYAGPVGWVDADGDGEWGIALRCALVAGERARLFAGAGVVAGSLPEAELEETRLKFRAMENALGLVR